MRNHPHKCIQILSFYIQKAYEYPHISYQQPSLRLNALTYGQSFAQRRYANLARDGASDTHLVCVCGLKSIQRYDFGLLGNDLLYSCR